MAEIIAISEAKLVHAIAKPDYFVYYNFKLSAYDGPLDLLLSLIKKNKINIYDIPIIEITKQYLEAIGLEEEDLKSPLVDFNLDAAGNFIEMAAQLIYIKSLTLIPSHNGEKGADDDIEQPDPRTELANMLLEYQKIKELASFLDNRPILGRDVFAINIFENGEISLIGENCKSEQGSNELFEANIFILSEYFYHKIKEAGQRVNSYEVAKENFSIKDKIIEIMERLNTSGRISFGDLLKNVDIKNESGLGEVFAYFLALLEMSRLILINLDQAQPFGDIYISLFSKTVLMDYRKKIANIL